MLFVDDSELNVVVCTQLCVICPSISKRVIASMIIRLVYSEVAIQADILNTLDYTVISACHAEYIHIGYVAVVVASFAS